MYKQRSRAQTRDSDKQGLEPVAATEAAAEAAVVVLAVVEAPPTYGIAASVTYVAGLRAMAAALVDALEGRQSGEK